MTPTCRLYRCYNCDCVDGMISTTSPVVCCDCDCANAPTFSSFRCCFCCACDDAWSAIAIAIVVSNRQIGALPMPLPVDCSFSNASGEPQRTTTTTSSSTTTTSCRACGVDGATRTTAIASGRACRNDGGCGCAFDEPPTTTTTFDRLRSRPTWSLRRSAHRRQSPAAPATSPPSERTQRTPRRRRSCGRRSRRHRWHHRSIAPNRRRFRRLR